MRTFGPVLLRGLLLAVISVAFAESLAAATVLDSARVALPGNVPPLARREFDVGRSDPTLSMERMILLLELRPGASARLDRLLTEQHSPASPSYHRWLTPEEFGTQFGLGDQAIKTVTGWLEEQGFTTEEVAKGRGWINFSGTAAQVERAFATEMHDYKIDGTTYHSNAFDPSLPRGLANFVNGIVSLNSFPPTHEHTGLQQLSELSPKVTDYAHYLAPADFATIYDLASAYGAGIDGSGVTIAITAVSEIKLSDVQTFRTTFGLPVNDPIFIHNGRDPGDMGGKYEKEADLDTEWSGAVAPKATIEVVISAHALNGFELSAMYIVDHNLADVMSTSLGQCELEMGRTKRMMWNRLYAQAVSQGITAFVASYDSGAAGCDFSNETKGHGTGVSGYCSTPYNVCVGGTEFDDTSDPSAYWSPINQPGTYGSALSYIPEVGWNESGLVSGGSQLWSSGGGASVIYAKPAWQSALGVPADGRRDVPDVSLAAALHDGYEVVSGGNFFHFRGTSAGAPSFAGVMALIVQKTGHRQGNANVILYQLANNQYSAAGPKIFHDVTSGNNSVPGVKGFSCGVGYDLVTGLGSVDGAALIENWP